MATEQYFNILRSISSRPISLLRSSDARTSSTSNSESSVLARVELGDGGFAVKGRIKRWYKKGVKIVIEK